MRILPLPSRVLQTALLAVVSVAAFGTTSPPDTLRAARVMVPQVVDTIRVASTPLEATSLSFAQALSEVAGEQLTLIFAGSGIRLHLDEVGHAGLSGRQAVASIREFLRGFEEGTAVVTRAAPVEGSSTRGFAEVLWSAKVTGTSNQVRRTLFLGLSRSNGEWRVDEVRFLR